MEQDNTQTSTTRKSTSRYAFFGFLVVGLIALIVSVCLANVNVTIDTTYRENNYLGGDPVIVHTDNADEGKSGLTGVKDNLIRDLDCAKDNDKVVNGIEKAGSQASLALVFYIIAIICGAGLVAIDAVQVFCNKNNKALKAGKTICFLLFLATVVSAVAVYFGVIHNLEVALEDALYARADNIEIISNAHVGTTLPIVFGLVGLFLAFIGYVAVSIANKQKNKQDKND